MSKNIYGVFQGVFSALSFFASVVHVFGISLVCHNICIYHSSGHCRLLICLSAAEPNKHIYFLDVQIISCALWEHNKKNKNILNTNNNNTAE